MQKVYESTFSVFCLAKPAVTANDQQKPNQTKNTTTNKNTTSAYMTCRECLKQGWRLNVVRVSQFLGLLSFHSFKQYIPIN